MTFEFEAYKGKYCGIVVWSRCKKYTVLLVNIDRSLAIYRYPPGGTPRASDPISELSTPVDSKTPDTFYLNNFSDVLFIDKTLP